MRVAPLRESPADLAREKHNTFQDRPIEEFLAFGNGVVDAINHALRNIPQDRVRMHVCWGNYEGPHDCDVDLEKIIPVIARAKVGGFMLPFFVAYSKLRRWLMPSSTTKLLVSMRLPIFVSAL